MRMFLSIKEGKMDKYNFFLNPYSDAAFTKCPKCEGKTKVKKLPLTIVMDKNKAVLNLNKTCKYCPYCELLIAKKSEMEPILKQFLGVKIISEKDYIVVGTLDKEIYRKRINQEEMSNNPLFGVIFFKDILEFTMQPAGWYPKK